MQILRSMLGWRTHTGTLTATPLTWMGIWNSPQSHTLNIQFHNVESHINPYGSANWICLLPKMFLTGLLVLSENLKWKSSLVSPGMVGVNNISSLTLSNGPTSPSRTWTGTQRAGQANVRFLNIACKFIRPPVITIRKHTNFRNQSKSYII